MREEEKKIDILRNVLSGIPDEPIPGIEALTDLIYRGIPAEIQLLEAAKPRYFNGKPKKLRKKTTHYLSEDIFENLGETRQKLAAMLSLMPKMRISKSRIVNQALETILDEFEEKGEESTLVQRILKRSPERE